MKRAERTMLEIAAELVLYGLFVAAYFFLVLHFLGDWLKEIFMHGRRLYAVVALLLMAGQAVGLEIVAGWIVALLHREKR
jgi:MFS family permease